MPDLKEQRADGRARFDQMVMNGRGQMPAWQGIVSQDRDSRALGLHTLPLARLAKQ